MKILSFTVGSVQNYLPPYLAFLNPIEECFSVVKSPVKNLIDYELHRNVGSPRGWLYTYRYYVGWADDHTWSECHAAKKRGGQPLQLSHTSTHNP